MSYKIKLSLIAEHDIIQALDYVEFILKNPKAADKLMEEIENQIHSLTDFPRRYAFVNEPVLSNWGIHFMLIDHYLLFFTIDEEKVNILRFLHEKSNWSYILVKEKNGMK